MLNECRFYHWKNEGISRVTVYNVSCSNENYGVLI